MISSKFHAPLIALAKSDKKTQRLLIKSLNNQIIRVLAQIAANVIQGNIPLSTVQKRRVLKLKKVFRDLRDKTKPIQRRRILLAQKGGFLPFLIPLAAGAVGGLLGKTLG